MLNGSLKCDIIYSWIVKEGRGEGKKWERERERVVYCHRCFAYQRNLCLHVMPMHRVNKNDRKKIDINNQWINWKIKKKKKNFIETLFNLHPVQNKCNQLLIYLTFAINRQYIYFKTINSIILINYCT